MNIETVQSFIVPGGAALIAGAMNALAGGGSFLSFPALLGAHIPPVNANTTNTVAMWPGNLLQYLPSARSFGPAEDSSFPS